MRGRRKSLKRLDLAKESGDSNLDFLPPNLEFLPIRLGFPSEKFGFCSGVRLYIVVYIALSLTGCESLKRLFPVRPSLLMGGLAPILP